MFFHKLTVTFSAFCLSALSLGAEAIGYNTHVRPILSDKCFLCHGPDVANNKAGFRMDTEESAYALLKDSTTKHGIVPGNADASEVWQRITSTDPDRVMPTPESNLALTDEEKAIIKAWIDQGAKYEPHWAFVNLPESVSIPEVSQPEWPKNPIDHFVAARLADEDLSPSPETAPARWFRRASYSITGLPPTEDSLQSFLSDLKTSGEKAYEKAADSLLSTRAYAEHIATPWLDAMRYADTWGYHSDMDFTAWPYRDYVIRSFEKDMPYDQFLTENIAGDLIPNATKDQILATASNRLNRMTNEGGSSALEFFVDGVSDRVNTYGTAYLGLTMECAKCHDHKYDPILARDYFQIFSFFNSIKETGLYVHGNVSPPPSLLLPDESQEKKAASLIEKTQSLIAERDTIRANARADFASWKNNAIAASRGEVIASDENALELIIADQAGHFDFDQSTEKPLESRVFSVSDRTRYDDKEKKEVMKGAPVMELENLSFTEGPSGYGSAIALNGDDGGFVKDSFTKDRYDPFSVSLFLKDTLREERSVVVLQRAFGTEVGYNGIDLTIENGYLSARIYRHWPGNGIGIKATAQLPKNKWHHLTWTYDGLSKASGLKLYLDGAPFETEIIGDRIFKKTGVKTYRPGHFILGSIFRGPGFKGGHVDELRTFERALTPLEVKVISGTQTLPNALVESTDEELYSYYLANYHGEFRRLSAEIAATQKAFVELEEDFLEVPVMEELKEARPAYVLARGEYNAERNDSNRVQRDSFSFLLPFPEDAPRNRLGLAQWMTLPNHPLTSRVYVNRIWQQVFGDGLVGTTENFGLQGDLPTHPQLLDWLCRDFIDTGWSTKRLIKQMVLSATFRQSSKMTEELAKKDLDNDLLSRGPAHRLSAEEIRDGALLTSGLLRETHGGAPVHPYGPKEAKTDTADNVHRRSVYSYWKRTVPQANMTIFDKPSLEVCSVERTRTNSPAQALVLLNDRHFIETARGLATRVLTAGGDDATQVQKAWKLATATEADENETRILQEILKEQREYFSNRPESASKLLAIGVSELPSGIDTTNAAAMTVVCQAIYNSDAAVYKR